MLASLGRAIEEGEDILDPRYLEAINLNRLEHILKGNIEIPLIEERMQFLKQLGSRVNKEYDGKFKGIIGEAKGDSVSLLEILTGKFMAFADISQYNNKRVEFYKRAQLLVADIYHVFKGQGYGNLKHVDRLTACADYKLPQVLRRLGILEYDKELSEKVDNGVLLESGSKEEVEIRANTIMTVELIKKKLEKTNPGILTTQINDHIWLLGQEKHEFDKPYHRTRTVAY